MNHWFIQLLEFQVDLMWCHSLTHPGILLSKTLVVPPTLALWPPPQSSSKDMACERTNYVIGGNISYPRWPLELVSEVPRTDWSAEHALWKIYQSRRICDIFGPTSPWPVPSPTYSWKLTLHVVSTCDFLPHTVNSRGSRTWLSDPMSEYSNCCLTIFGSHRVHKWVSFRATRFLFLYL